MLELLQRLRRQIDLSQVPRRSKAHQRAGSPGSPLSRFQHAIAHRFQREGTPAIDVWQRTLVQGGAVSAEAAPTGLIDWLSTRWRTPSPSLSGSAPPSLDAAGADEERLDQVRDEFLHMLDGVRSDDAALVQARIRFARTQRDLWHLRPELFRLVALQFSQAEAQSRLDLLNRHFPTRSPRSGFAPLEPLPGDGRPSGRR
jgi:hypothetical protein